LVEDLLCALQGKIVRFFYVFDELLREILGEFYVGVSRECKSWTVKEQKWVKSDSTRNATAEESDICVPRVTLNITAHSDDRSNLQSLAL
jgi:hypothetical protein